MNLKQYEPFIEILSSLSKRNNFVFGPNPDSLDEITEKPHSYIVVNSLIRNAMSYAKAIESLIKVGGAEATFPLLRSIYEIQLEIENLLRYGKPEENAAKFTINAALDIESHLEEQSDYEFEKILSSVKQVIESQKVSSPKAFEKIKEQRRKRQFNWSGESRSKTERNIFKRELSLYKLMSWEAHSSLASLSNFRIVKCEDFARLEFDSFDPILFDPGLVAFLTVGILFRIFDAYAVVFPQSCLDQNPWSPEEI